MTDKWSVEDFLSQYNNEGTLNLYRSTLRDYFKLFYPELQKHSRKTVDKFIKKIKFMNLITKNTVIVKKILYIWFRFLLNMNGINIPRSLEEPETHAPLWRYMSLTKFLDLMTTGQLYLMKGRKLKKYDKYEGIFPFHQINDMSDNLAKLSDKCWMYAPDKVKEEYDYDKTKLLEFWNELCYVSCWHGNSSESAAMWKIYSGFGTGVAIKTNHVKLLRSFSDVKDPWFIAKVKYVDPAFERIVDDNLYYPLFHKRLCYEYEKEVRIVVFRYDEENSRGSELRPLSKDGIRLTVDLDKLIDYVVLSPETPEYFESVIKSIISKYGYNFNFRYARTVNDPLLE